jgi:tetratricopeptide (TPR) repeat protein
MRIYRFTGGGCPIEDCGWLCSRETRNSPSGCSSAGHPSSSPTSTTTRSSTSPPCTAARASPDGRWTSGPTRTESTLEYTPLEGAREGGHEEIAALLRAGGGHRVRASEGGTDDWIAKADAAVNWGDLREAIASVDRAVERHPRAVRAFVHKGDLLRHHGRLLDSLGCYDRAIAIDPGFSGGMAWCNKGCALQELGRLKEATSCYEEVLKHDHEDARACFNIGVVRHDQGRTKGAIPWYRAALEGDPDCGPAKAYRAAALDERDSGSV